MRDCIRTDLRHTTNQKYPLLTRSRIYTSLKLSEKASHVPLPDDVYKKYPNVQ